MAYFAQPRLGRDQRILIPNTLEDVIPDDHPVRILDELLAQVDWTPWELRYDGRRGQPPIHPRVMAAVLLYGLQRRVRSSRTLEYLITHAVDFMWLAEGRTIDYSTLCIFRTKFKDELKDLFRQVARIAMSLGWLRLEEMAIDGTRVQANNARDKTWTAEKVRQAAEELAAQWGKLLDETEQADAADDLQATPAVPPELADARQRQQLLKEVLAQLQAADEARRKEGTNPTKNPAQLPSTDSDSKVMPNKEGGYAPNYTPLAATDTHGGFIVYTDVIGEVTESTQLVTIVDSITEDFGQQPEAALADGHYATGANIEACEARGIDLCSPVPPQGPQPGNPALREDPTQPVPAEKRAELPINPQSKKLDKSCFMYDPEQNCFFCPEGKRLDFEKDKPDTRQGQKIKRKVYRCHECEGCPLAGACISGTNRGGRTVTRDEYSPARERQAAKMQTPEAKERYKRRLHPGETPFAWIKDVLGLRQFLLRGLEKVKIEWLWACTAFNLRKLVLAMARLRAEQASLLAATGS
jgi:transposase